jgi:tripartite-type tricarboxylate transporter receptor subunit TctC
LKAAPDGYTLLMFSTSALINVSLNEKPKFDFRRDIIPVASIARGPLAMVVNPSFPANSVPEFINYARLHRGMVAMASSGRGGANHIAGELFQAIAGLKMLDVPYPGDAPALIGLLGGQVQVYFSTLFGSIQHIRSGALRPLAVTTSVRAKALPEVPAMAEYIPGYEATCLEWVGRSERNALGDHRTAKSRGQRGPRAADHSSSSHRSWSGGAPMLTSRIDYVGC